MISELIGVITGAVLTLFVFSYLFQDNPLFRFSIYLFIGVSAGFGAAVAIRNVIIPRLLAPPGGLLAAGNLWGLIPLLLSILMLTKLSKNTSNIGNIPMAFMVGIGAAAAIGGAILGTLIPQTEASINLLDLQSIQIADPFERIFEAFSRMFALVGTVATLMYFHFGARVQDDDPPERNPLIEMGSKIGQGFIAVTFGVLFAGVFAATLTAFIERVQFFMNIFR